MPSFYLQSIDEDGATTTKSFESCYLNDTIEYVSDFLSGCGFCFEEIKVVNKQFDASEDEINVVKTNEGQEHKTSVKRVANTTDTIYRSSD